MDLKAAQVEDSGDQALLASTTNSILDFRGGGGHLNLEPRANTQKQKPAAAGVPEICLFVPRLPEWQGLELVAVMYVTRNTLV